MLILPRFTARLSLQLSVLAVLTGIILLAGCGGGNSSSAPATFPVSGQLTDTPTRAATRAVLPGDPVSGYIWPDLTTVVATGTTDANGNYTLKFPASASGKTGVVVALQTVGGKTSRYSAIVPGLTGSAVTGANIDPATTVSTELILASAKTGTVPANLSGSAYASIYAEARAWGGLSGLDLTVGGANIPAALGGGLKAGGPASTFFKGDALVAAELPTIGTTASTDVANGREAVQMVRSLFSGVVSNAQSEKTSISAAAMAQQTALTNATQGASAFAQRTKILGQVLGLKNNDEGLTGLPPGTYQQVANSQQFGFNTILNRTGASSDGKSWVVTSAVTGPTYGLVVTVTPKNAIPTFALNPSAGTLTLSVRNPGDATVQYDAQLATTLTGPTVTTEALTATFKDSALSTPITFTGTVSATPATGATQTGPYTAGTFSGTLATPFGTLQITNLNATWFNTTSSGGVQKITLGGLSLVTTASPAASLTVSNVEVDFSPPTATSSGGSILKQISFSGELKASGYDVVASNVVIGLTPTSGGSLSSVRPSSASGQVTYTSPTLAFQGALTGTWTNPSLNTSTIAGFPLGSVHVTGTLTPTATKVAYGADMTLAGTVSGTNGVGTLTIKSLSLGSQSLSGTATATYPSTAGVINSSAATYAATLTHSPTGVQINLAGASANPTGTITHGGAGTAKIADIGKANTLGLNDLGSAVIIKYVDGTFESAASILP